MPSTMTPATTAIGNVDGSEKGWPEAQRAMAETSAAAEATGKTCRQSALSLTGKAWLLVEGINGWYRAA